LTKAGFDLAAPEPGSRTTPSGSVLKWQTFDLRTAVQGAPFFIEWSADTPHPATTSPSGCTLVSFQIASPDSTRLRAFNATLNLETTIVDGPRLLFALTISCPKGHLTFRS
jgi:hypothetical protein